jgi:hypothetical protein
MGNASRTCRSWLNLVANSFAVVALIAEHLEHLLWIAFDLTHRGRKGADIVRLSGVISSVESLTVPRKGLIERDNSGIHE